MTDLDSLFETHQLTWDNCNQVLLTSFSMEECHKSSPRHVTGSKARSHLEPKVRSPGC